jgi:hypothetical protein
LLVSAFKMKAVNRSILRLPESFQLLIDRLGQASSAEIESVLSAREQVEPEAELSPEIVDRLQEKIRTARIGKFSYDVTPDD